MYHCLFVSHLTYGITCWGDAYTSKLQKLFSIQNMHKNAFWSNLFIRSCIVLLHTCKAYYLYRLKTHSQIIIPYLNNNSDMTVSVCCFKNELENFFYKFRRKVIPLTGIKLNYCTELMWYRLQLRLSCLILA